MILFRAKLFDGFLSGTSNVYTQTADAELLGSVERVTIGFVFDGLTGTGLSFNLQFENSPDGTRWMNQNATPEYTLSISNGLAVTTNYDPTTIPIAGYVRLRMALVGTNPAGYLRLWAIGRS